MEASPRWPPSTNRVGLEGSTVIMAEWRVLGRWMGDVNNDDVPSWYKALRGWKHWTFVWLNHKLLLTTQKLKLNAKLCLLVPFPSPWSLFPSFFPTLIWTLSRRKIIKHRSKVSLFRETASHTHSFHLQENFGEKGTETFMAFLDQGTQSTLWWCGWTTLPKPQNSRGKNIQTTIFSVLPKLVHSIGDVCQLLEA